MITPADAADLGSQVAAYIKAIDSEIPFLEGLTGVERGNFICSLGHTFLQCMAHNHWIEDHANPQIETMMKTLQEFLNTHKEGQDEL